MASMVYQHVNLPQYISSYLGHYLHGINNPRSTRSIEEHHGKDYVKLKLKDYLRKLKVRYNHPPLQFIANAVKSDIKQLHKKLINTPMGSLSDQLQVNTVVLLVWYTKVGNTKGDRDWLLREFYRQYAYVYTAVKYNRIRTM